MTFMKSILSSIRRRYIFYFRRDYFDKMLASRKGRCDCGGICCQRTRRCPFFKDKRCSIYMKGIPFFCKIFPIDRKDMELAGVDDVCTYHWDG